MVGSLDSLDFSDGIPVIERIAIPLDCWQTISLPDIWIPSILLLNRNKGCDTGGTKSIYKTLQKKDASKYSESFSVYIDSGIENEQEDTFLSDSDEDMVNTSMNLEKIQRLSDNLSVNLDDASTPFPKSFNHNEKKCYENDNALFRRNDDSVYSNSKASNVNNLSNYEEEKNANMLCLDKNPEKSYRSVDKDNNIFIRNIEKINYNGSQSSSASKSVFLEQIKDFNSLQTLKNVNKDSDSHISLNEIINDAPVTSLKDFDCNFGIRKKEKDLDYYSICDKPKLNSKKNKKDKKGKNLEKVPLDLLFEDPDATQNFNCDRYMNSVLLERERYARVGDNPLVSKEEYPDLTPEEQAFIHFDNMEGENTKSEKYAGVGGFNSVHSEEYLDLTSEDLDLTSDLTFYRSDNIMEGENVEFTPTFSFINSDKATKGTIVANDSISNDLNTYDTTVENVEVGETADFLELGKIVIENIPPDISKEDISSILCGYGEIKNFSMISSGKCLKVFVEIDLICDIDWVIECLNGSEPFGTSTGVLKCYEQTE